MIPWIQRNIANEIFHHIQRQEDELTIYLLQGEAGIGKTFLARDIGFRLGSASGYEAGHQGRIYWSGIIDLYDRDTNNNPGIEKHLIQAFQSEPVSEFESYEAARETYIKLSRGGTGGPELETHRKEVERVFASGMAEVCRKKYPVIAVDTVERLQSALDPTQRELKEPIDDTASVVGWLLFQIQQLPRGTILLFGRRAERFEKDLTEAIQKARRSSSGLPAITLEQKNLNVLQPEELANFFESRTIRYPDLTKLLDDGLKELIIRDTHCNPLLLDIALQTLLETRSPQLLRDFLTRSGGVEEIAHALIAKYMTIGPIERRTLLSHLTLARNGLFPELLERLEPRSFDRMLPELQRMGELPYIKVRQVWMTAPGSANRSRQTVYFLHDAMYEICEAVVLKPEEARQHAQVIVNWYDEKLKPTEKSETAVRPSAPIEGLPSFGRRPVPIVDLLVDSLFYRLRADPRAGYEWYLQQADQAARLAETGLDMRLRDAMAQFIDSAAPDQQEDAACSQIDRQNVMTLFRDLYDHYRIDSAMLWIKRLSHRGNHGRALEIGKQAVWVDEIYRNDPKRFALAEAELRLWQGQAAMYAGKIETAMKLYHQIQDRLEGGYAINELRRQKDSVRYEAFELWRASLVQGRARNNQGYLDWMYLGKYKWAIRSLKKAVEFFELGGHVEELANTRDNLGRIYAVQGLDYASTKMINLALEKRRELKLDYRIALSLNSLALAYAYYEKIVQALAVVDEAMEIFKNLEIDRGRGLASLTRGGIHRTRAELWRDQNLTLDAALNEVDLAEKDLRTAIHIFQGSVQESIRYAQTYNELACCFRTRYMLRRSQKAPDWELEEIFEDGQRYFQGAVQIARENNYFIERLDSLQDLAVLLLRAKEYKEAQKILDGIRAEIPQDHLFQPGQEMQLISEDRLVDFYLRLMGQVELLAGAIVYDSALKDGKASRQAYLDTMEHYVLATAYFYRFSGHTYTHRQTNERIHKRFEGCPPDLTEEIWDQRIPEWIEKYGIPEDWVRKPLEEVFELLRQG